MDKRHSLTFSTLFILLVFYLTPVQAQIQFQSSFGGLQDEDRLYSVVPTSDGYIATGLTRAFAEDRNAYVIKIDQFGRYQWSTVLGDTGNDRGREIKQTDDGGYIMTGYTESYGPGDIAVWLVKLSENGDVEWSKAYGGSGDDRGFDIHITSDGGYIIAGYSNSYNPTGEYDVYLVKTDANGNLEWANAYGGPGDDRSYSVQEVSGGGFVATGRTNSFGAGDDDIYLVKVDSDGEFVWGSAFGGQLEDRSYGLIETQDDNYVIVGRTESFRGGIYDVYLIKADQEGELLWSKTYGGELGDDIGRAIIETEQGDLVVSGYSRSFGGNDDLLYAFKTNPNGDLVWDMAYGHSHRDRGFSVTKGHDDGYLFGGYSDNFSGNELEYYFIKTDRYGNTACNQQSINSTVSEPSTQEQLNVGLQRGEALAQDVNVTQNEPFTIERDLCCHAFSGFDYTVDGHEVTFNALVNNANNYSWDLGDGNTASQQSFTHTYSSTSPREVCLTVDVHECGTPEEHCKTIMDPNNLSAESNYRDALKLYPNPAGNNTVLHLENAAMKSGEVMLYTLSGKLLKSVAVPEQSDKHEIDLSDIEDGMYILRFRQEEIVINKKLIISR